MINNTTLSDTETKDRMRSYISENYKSLSNLAKSISRTDFWDELLSESTISILSMKRVPENVVLEGKEFVYIFGIMKRIYHSASVNFKDRFHVQGYDPELIPEIEDIEETYDFTKESVYSSVYDYVNQLEEKGTITTYEKNVFILYNFPDRIEQVIKLTPEKRNILKNSKLSYRTISQITGINFQSLRYTNLEVLKIIKSNINKPEEVIEDYSHKITFKS